MDFHLARLHFHNQSVTTRQIIRTLAINLDRGVTRRNLVDHARKRCQRRLDLGLQRSLVT